MAERKLGLQRVATFDLDAPAKRHAWGVFRDRRVELLYAV